MFRYLEIAVKQCRNGGIDCKIHGLQVVGKKRSDEDSFSSNLSFLTSDSEEFDDQVPVLFSVFELLEHFQLLEFAVNSIGWNYNCENGWW